MSMNRPAGAEWLANSLRWKGRPAPSALGRDVAEILGLMVSGLYHLPDNALFHERTQWHSEHAITLVIRKTLSTFDFSELTDLVFACVQRNVRCEIGGRAPGYLELVFIRLGPAVTLNRIPDPAEFLERVRLYTAPAAAEVAP